MTISPQCTLASLLTLLGDVTGIFMKKKIPIKKSCNMTIQGKEANEWTGFSYMVHWKD